MERERESEAPAGWLPDEPTRPAPNPSEDDTQTSEWSLVPPVGPPRERGADSEAAPEDWGARERQPAPPPREEAAEATEPALPRPAPGRTAERPGQLASRVVRRLLRGEPETDKPTPAGEVARADEPAAKPAAIGQPQVAAPEPRAPTAEPSPAATVEQRRLAVALGELRARFERFEATSMAGLDELRGAQDAAHRELRDAQEAGRSELRDGQEAVRGELVEIRRAHEVVQAEFAELRRAHESDRTDLAELRRAHERTESLLQELRDSQQSANAELAELRRARELDRELIEVLKPRPQHAAEGVEPQASIDLNAATFEDLRAIGLSPTQATRVVARRESIGTYTSADQLDELPGFPPDQLEALKQAARL